MNKSSTTCLNSFAELLIRAIELVFLGVIRRIDSFHEGQTEIMPSTLLLGKSYMAQLNVKYHLGALLPTNDYAVFQMFERPLIELRDKLPDELRKLIGDDSMFWHTDALIEGDLSGDYFLTPDGEYLFSDLSAIREAYQAKDTLLEYHSQQIYSELLKSDYIDKRLFLINPENAYFSEYRFNRSDAQNEFIAQHPGVIENCYKKVESNQFYRCKNCGCLIIPEVNACTCTNPGCRGKSLLVEKTNLSGKYYVLNQVAQRFVYNPGCLEKQIFDLVMNSPNVVSYKLWPGEDSDRVDDWDMEFTLNDGSTYLIDAKDVSNPNFLIRDRRKIVSGKQFLYVVPNGRSKKYVETVNQAIGPDARCMRLKELKEIL